MKIVSVVGARPQFVKLGPLSRELRKSHEEIIIHTGQHYDLEMSDLFFEQLEIPKPEINLAIGSGLHGEQTGRMLVAIETELIRIKPSLLITFGDTNTTLAACVAAAKLQVPSLHIEAGLRSHNRSMPEEINRVVADHTSDLLFAPTTDAVANLTREGLKSKTILTGDIMVDSVSFVQRKIGTPNVEFDDYYLLTLHRPYNVDDPQKLTHLFNVFAHVPNPIIFPAHPRTRLMIERCRIEVPAQVVLMEPQGYIEFQTLLKYCSKVITDSGGLQKEAYLAGKPCITVRQETEWVETVDAGWNVLVDIMDSKLLSTLIKFNPTDNCPNLYGSNVAKRMVDEIALFLSNRA
jgi:UDP-GlcNAc3NAcA epimerase